jgi:hypothetical protein
VKNIVNGDKHLQQTLRRLSTYLGPGRGLIKRVYSVSMKRSLFSSPEPFSFAPFLHLLPVGGTLGRLESLNSSFYARLEKVRSQQENLEGSSELARSLRAEAQMLQQVLDWISSVSPQQ